MRVRNECFKVLEVLQDFYSFDSTKLCTKNLTLPPCLLTHCISINFLNQEMTDELQQYKQLF